MCLLNQETCGNFQLNGKMVRQWEIRDSDDNRHEKRMGLQYSVLSGNLFKTAKRRNDHKSIFFASNYHIHERLIFF